jgi:hypothetical protein
LINSQLRPSPRAPAARSGAHQHERAVQLLAGERELELPALQRSVDVGIFGQPHAAIPDHHRSAAVLAGGNHSLEGVVVVRMVLGAHRQALDGSDRATGPWAPPTRAGRRSTRGGGRSGARGRGACAPRSEAGAARARSASAAPRPQARA